MKRILLFASLVLLCSLASVAQLPSLFSKSPKDGPEILFKSKQSVRGNKNGKMIVSRQQTPKSVKIFDFKSGKLGDKVKLPKGLEMHSSIMSLKDRWLYLNNLEKGSFSKGDYQLVELDENAKFVSKNPVLSCEEKLGEWKFQGIRASSTMVPFDARLSKSENEEYFSVIASKYYGIYSRQAGIVNLKDYRKTEEELHFAVFNAKLDIQKKGTFKPGITRGDITFFRSYLSNQGELYLVYGLRQEFGKTSNRILLLKISMEEESVERVTFNLPKFNTKLLGTIFTDELFQFTGFVDSFKDKVDDISGVFNASIDNRVFQLKDADVVLFSDEQKKQMNSFYDKDREELVEWSSENGEVFHQTRAYGLEKNNKFVGIMCRYFIELRAKLTNMKVGDSYSSDFYIRFGEGKKSIKDITYLNTPKGYDKCFASPINIGNELYMTYLTRKEIKALKIPNLNQSFGDPIVLGSANVGKEKWLQFNGRGYYFDNERNILYAGFTYNRDNDNGEVYRRYDRVVKMKIKWP